MSLKTNGKLTSADLFAGAGGLSLGFENAGFKTVFAVERDIQSAETYLRNRSENSLQVLTEDISKVDFKKVLHQVGLRKGELDILLGGPPCQGFSTSNMKTRTKDNPMNNMFKEFLRAVREINPKWLLFENVAGIVSFEKGDVVNIIKEELSKLGYSFISSVLNATEYGVPQLRHRFFLVANRTGSKFEFPSPIYGQNGERFRTVREAISDLPSVESGNQEDPLPYSLNGVKLAKYQKEMRRVWRKTWCSNNLVTNSNPMIVERYKYIPPGGNWKNIPDHLMQNYKNTANCHSGIYRRLEYDKPSIVISNFRKGMLIHPIKHRGLSVREAARLQSFPDDYLFFGNLGNQQQQVANAVPPLLANSIANHIAEFIVND